MFNTFKYDGLVKSHFFNRRDAEARRKAPKFQYVLLGVSVPQRWIFSFYDFIKYAIYHLPFSVRQRELSWDRMKLQP